MSKRARTSSTSSSDSSLPPPLKLSPSFLLPLSSSLQSELLLQACESHPLVLASVVEALDKISKIKIDFDHHSKTFWSHLQTEGRDARADDDIAGDALHSLCHACQDITTRTTERSAFETKESAISTLRKMGKSLVLAETQVGRTLRNDGGTYELISAMKAVVSKMSEEERREGVDAELANKLKELVSLWDSYALDEDGELKEIAGLFEREE